MPLQEDYLVSLDTFRGPLDLLLYLIRRSEVDIHDIPIASITEQYLQFLRQIDHVDIELAGEFLVMAATISARPISSNGRSSVRRTSSNRRTRNLWMMASISASGNHTISARLPAPTPSGRRLPICR